MFPTQMTHALGDEYVNHADAIIVTARMDQNIILHPKVWTITKWQLKTITILFGFLVGFGFYLKCFYYSQVKDWKTEVICPLYEEKDITQG